MVDICQQRFVNLFTDEGFLDAEVLQSLAFARQPVVGMGKVVQKILDRYSIPNIKIVHPAARGKYKQRDTYMQHLRERLLLADR